MSGMKPLAMDDFREALDLLPPKYAAIAVIGVTTGARVSETLGLRRSDVLKKDGTLKDVIQIERLKRRGKGNKYRRFSIPEAYRTYLLRCLHDEELRGYEQPGDAVFRGSLGRPLTRFQVYRVFHDLLGPGYGTHWMRKTFAREMLHGFHRCGMVADEEIKLLQIALGHAKKDTTEHYISVDESLIGEVQQHVFS